MVEQVEVDCMKSEGVSTSERRSEGVEVRGCEGVEV